ncbi:MAG: response regulator, partial [Desulfonatronovibrionaceae bacterium]
GLSLVKRLVSQLGGTVSLDSREGEGTDVYVNLPCQIPMSDANRFISDREGKKTVPPSGGRILLAEDDPTTQFSTRRLLEKLGYSVRVAENGNEVLDALEEEDFDCILMDVQLPVLDGLQTVKEIRTSGSKFNRIPVIALTAYAQDGDRERFLKAGMDDYAAKPVDMDTLTGILEKNLIRRRRTSGV